MQPLESILTINNIDEMLGSYLDLAETIGDSIAGLNGLPLLQALKRDSVGVGPYPNVALFEAANRIMTDLVILYGVRWLLRSAALPFDRYSVEYGHASDKPHDIMANASGRVLIGEAFNVAPSFFALKKSAAVKKLRESSISANYRAIMCNRDATRHIYTPRLFPGELFVRVDTTSGNANVIPECPRPAAVLDDNSRAGG